MNNNNSFESVTGTLKCTQEAGTKGIDGKGNIFCNFLYTYYHATSTARLPDAAA
jgi:hypothetical protein